MNLVRGEERVSGQIRSRTCRDGRDSERAGGWPGDERVGRTDFGLDMFLVLYIRWITSLCNINSISNKKSINIAARIPSLHLIKV